MEGISLATAAGAERSRRPPLLLRWRNFAFGILLVGLGPVVLHGFSPIVLHPAPTHRLHPDVLCWLSAIPTSSDGYYYQDSMTTGRRRPVMAGNWKLNPETFAEARNLLKLLQADFVNHRESEDVEVIVFPPFPFLAEALNVLEGSGIKVGAQNIGLQTAGAFTGEVSASQLATMGCDYVLLGHSERRALFDETDADINKKVHLCLDQSGLAVILCVGETEDEYESELLQSVCDLQVRKGLQGIAAADALERIVIAYEPVWAIGTGKVATPEQAQEAHVVIRKTLQEMYGYDVASRIRIQYGGSVKPDNVDDLMKMPDVDGALVGGASLTADSFTRIVDGATSTDFPAVASPRELKAKEVVPTKNVLGESPVWSTRDQALYWISAPEEEVWTWNLKDPAYRRLAGTTLGCVAVLQDANNASKGSVVLAGERAFLQMNLSSKTGDFASGPTVLSERPEQTDITRPNDGRVDRQGRLVFGMYNNYHRSPVGNTNVCGIYRFNEHCELESLLPDDSLNYRVSNCICFPDSGETMFFCDTPTRKIYSFDYPKESGGKLSNRRLVWTMPSNLPGGPDGAQVGK